MSQSRQLAAIMFTDIVGYTALMGEDEQKAFELLKKNRSVQRPLIEKFNGRWLKEMGDGVLASFSTVSDAVYCAATIQKICEDHPELNLRIGIHLGEVVFEGDDVFGDGVNIASRIEPLAPAGGILVSESVHKNLLNKKGIESNFIGEKHLKNVKESVRLYQVFVEGVEQMILREESHPPHKFNYKKIIYSVAIVLILFLSYYFYSKQRIVQAVEPQKELIDRTIAVLPFADLSPNQDQQYFSVGMMDEILNHLVKIEDLQVTSRTSVMQYSGTTKSMKDISEELGVTNILVGSVRKSGNKVRITVQLIDGRTDKHLWSEIYDRNLDDIFVVQRKRG